MTPGLQITEVVCGTKPKIFCYAMVHALKLRALVEVPFKNPKRGKPSSGVALHAEVKGHSMMFAFTFCPWCGGPLQ